MNVKVCSVFGQKYLGLSFPLKTSSNESVFVPFSGRKHLRAVMDTKNSHLLCILKILEQLLKKKEHWVQNKSRVRFPFFPHKQKSRCVSVKKKQNILLVWWRSTEKLFLCKQCERQCQTPSSHLWDPFPTHKKGPNTHLWVNQCDPTEKQNTFFKMSREEKCQQTESQARQVWSLFISCENRETKKLYL